MEQDLDYKEIGSNIRYYRQKAGLRQNQLSDVIDVSPQHISHIESGTKLSLPVLVKITNALSVDTDSLLREALHERTKYFSPEDYDKLLKLCDLIFE